MKTNRIMWTVISIVGLITIGLSQWTVRNKGQESSYAQQLPTTPPTLEQELVHYASVEYDSPGDDDPTADQQRRHRNRRYDKQAWVFKKAGPEVTAVGRYDEVPAPPRVPVDESLTIVVGKAVKAEAFLSNDKSGVYTELTFQVNEVLKSDSARLAAGAEIVADRPGGIIVYPGGQRVLYRENERDIPRTAQDYILFLSCDGRSPNYQIIRAYAITGNSLRALDFPTAENINKTALLDNIRQAVEGLRHKQGRDQK